MLFANVVLNGAAVVAVWLATSGIGAMLGNFAAVALRRSAEERSDWIALGRPGMRLGVSADGLGNRNRHETVICICPCPTLEPCPKMNSEFRPRSLAGCSFACT